MKMVKDATTLSATNAYGIISYARFFVSRVTFLRSIKRLLIFSLDGIFFVDPQTDEVKEQYEYNDEKFALVIGSDQALDNNFTVILMGKTKETYNCRHRAELFSVYHGLREQKQIALRQEHEKNKTLEEWSLPSLVQRFEMTKISSTQSQNSHEIVKVMRTLVVRAASLDRVDSKTKQTLSSIPLINIVKIQRLQRESNGLMIYFTNQDIHRYWCPQREPFIQAVSNNLRSWLSLSLQVDEAIDDHDFYLLVLNRGLASEKIAAVETPPGRATTIQYDMHSEDFSMPVEKLTKTSYYQKQQPPATKSRTLVLTSSMLIERDGASKRNLKCYRISDIYNIVIYSNDPVIQKTQSPENDLLEQLEHDQGHYYSTEEGEEMKVMNIDSPPPPSQSRQQYLHQSSLTVDQNVDLDHLMGSFAIELKSGRTLRYYCEPCHITERNGSVQIGMSRFHSSEKHEEFEQLFQTRPAGSEPLTHFQVAGGCIIYSPEGARSLFLSNLFEIARMNHIQLSWSMEETPLGMKEGNWNTPCNPEFEDILCRKLAGLVSTKSWNEIFVTLLEFNANLSMSGSRPRDRKALVAIMKLIDYFSKPTPSEKAVPNRLFCQVLCTFQRLVYAKNLFEELSSSQYKKTIGSIVALIQSSSRSIGFAAAQAFKFMLIQQSETKHVSKIEAINRKSILILPGDATSSSTAAAAASSADTRTYYDIIFETLFSTRNASSSSSGRMMDQIAPGNATEYLIVSTLLQTLEVCLSSGKKGTPEKVFINLLQQMDMLQHHHRQRLFQYCRAPCFAMMKSAAVLLRVHILEQAGDLVEELQHHAREDGILIWQLYLSLLPNSKIQKKISSQLVALLTHENARSSAVIRRIFPPALIDDLVIGLDVQYDAFGHIISQFGFDSLYSKSNASKKPTTDGSTTTLTQNPMATPDAGSSLNNNATMNNANNHAPAAISSSLSTGDGIRSPRQTPAGEGKTTTRVLRATHREVSESTKCVVLLPEFFERIGTGIPSKDKGVETKNCLWNYRAVDELRRVLCRELNELDLARGRYFEYQASDPARSLNLSPNPAPLVTLNWNAEAFEMHYRCFDDRIQVGPYYLENILNDHGQICQDIEFPQHFLTLLMTRVLAEADEGIQLLCLQVMTQVYLSYENDLGPCGFLTPLLQHATNKSSSSSWSLVLRGNVVGFIEKTLKNALNVRQFCFDARNIEMVLQLLIEVRDEVPEEPADSAATLDPIRLTEEEEEDKQENVITAAKLHQSLSEETDFFSCSDSNASSPGRLSLSMDSSSPKPNHHPHDELLDDASSNSLSLLSLISPAASPKYVSVVNALAMTATGVTKICLGICMKIISCEQRLVSFPLSPSQVTLSQDFQLFIPCLAHASLFRTTLGLISRIVHHQHAQLIPTMYRTGVFYYLFRYFPTSTTTVLFDTKERLNLMIHMAELLSQLHLRQDHHEQSSDHHSNDNPIITAPDPLTRLCMKSALVPLLPISLIATLVRHGPARFARAFLRDSDDPEVMWNQSMRERLRTHLDKYLLGHQDLFQRRKMPTRAEFYDHPMTRVAYPKEVCGFQCYQYYLENLLLPKYARVWKIEQPNGFLLALLDSLRQWCSPTAPRTFQFKEVLLLLRSMVFLFEKCRPDLKSSRSCSGNTSTLDAESSSSSLPSTTTTTTDFSIQPSMMMMMGSSSTSPLDHHLDENPFVQFPGFPTLFQVVDKIVGQLSLDKEEKEEAREIFFHAIQCMALAVQCSQYNRDQCSTSQGIHITLVSMKQFKSLDCFVAETQHALVYLFLALSEMLSSFIGRSALAANACVQVTEGLEFILGFCRLEKDQDDHHRVAVDTTVAALRILVAICSSSGIAEILIQYCIQLGIHWHLLELLFQYETTSGRKNELAQWAAHGLFLILNLSIDEESIAPVVYDIQHSISRLLTPNLVFELQNASSQTHHHRNLDVNDHDHPKDKDKESLQKDNKQSSFSPPNYGSFLELFQSEQQQPTLMWTRRMKAELVQILDRSRNEKSGQYRLPDGFMYTDQREELRINSIYLRFLNDPAHHSTAEFNNLPDVHKFMKELVLNLRQSVSGVRAEPSVLPGILFRLVPILEAIRNMLAYKQGMDIVLVKELGIGLLFVLLEQEPFGSSPQLQCLALECIHVCLFSRKGLEKIATYIPTYGRVLFGLLSGFQNEERFDKQKSLENQTPNPQSAQLALQILGHVCLFPACIDSVVKGMNVSILCNLIPDLMTSSSSEQQRQLQLLFCIHLLPLRRHKDPVIALAKAAVEQELIETLLAVLSSSASAVKTKETAARFLSVLQAIPGKSSLAITKILKQHANVWSVYEQDVIRSKASIEHAMDDVKELLVKPDIPALLG